MQEVCFVLATKMISISVSSEWRHPFAEKLFKWKLGNKRNQFNRIISQCRLHTRAREPAQGRQVPSTFVRQKHINFPKSNRNKKKAEIAKQEETTIFLSSQSLNQINAKNGRLNFVSFVRSFVRALVYRFGCRDSTQWSILASKIDNDELLLPI